MACLGSSNGRYKHGGKGTRLYRIWKGIRGRCLSATNKHYGAKGIAICNEWSDFAVFRDWAQRNGYADTLTIERLDNNLGYTPDNCKWITRADQTLNTSRNVIIFVKGEKMTVSQLAKAHGLSQQTVLFRVKNNWPVELLTVKNKKGTNGNFRRSN